MDTLKQFPQWVCYSSSKIPIDPKTGKAADSTNPLTWSDYHTAVSAQNLYHKAVGIGFVFTKESGIVGVDLDDCLSPDGNIKPESAWIVDHLNSYTEISPSKTGLHIFVKGTIPRALKRKDIEIYDSGRYFTVTGKHYPDTPLTIENRDKQIMTVYETHKVTPEKIRDLLKSIPPSGLDYDTEWLAVLMAVHSEFPNDMGLQLVKEWTEGTSKPNELENKWRSFKPNGGRGIGTLIHLAKRYGYDSVLDTIHPPLTHSQKIQASQIINRLVHERVWNVYRQYIQPERLNLTQAIVDHFELGYRPRKIDQETGEIEPGAVTVPFWQRDNNVGNVEFRMSDDYDYYGELALPFYCKPLFPDHEPGDLSLVLPDSLLAINTMLQHGLMTYKDKPIEIWGLPHQTITTFTADTINSNDIVVILADGYDKTRLKPFKDARFLVLPRVELLSETKTDELKRMIRFSVGYNHLV